MIKKIILFLFIATFAFANESYELIQDKSNLPFLAPSLQARKTAKLRLKNGLEVYLISDPKAEESSALLGVRAGSWQDPEKYPGTAHFLEHMLFQGSKKYPKEHAFDRFVLDHGGQYNAYTASDRTVYLFSIHHQAFDEALDRLAQFFIAPLFNPSAVARELHAVDQEYAQYIENDGRRASMISKELGNPDHPNQGFHIGNAQTLGQIPQDVLRKWYETNYSANLMTLEIYSAKPIDALKKLAADTFTQVENKKIQPAKIDQPLSSNAQLGHFIYIEPVKKIQHLTMQWELPASFVEDETKAADLLAYTINRGQKNNLLETLKKEGLAESLKASIEKEAHHNDFFEICITLTDQGVAQVPLVIQRCFETLAGLRSTGIPSYLFEEMTAMRKLSYQYQPRKDAFEFIWDHSMDILYEPLATYPAKTLLPSRYEPEKVQSLLHFLQPEHCQYYILANGEKTKVQPDRKEKWLGGAYAVRAVAEDQLSAWKAAAPHPNIALPEPNLFVPSKLQLLPATKSTIPLKIADNKHGKAFYFKDNVYQTPEVVHLVHIKSPLIDGTPRSATLMDLYLESIQDKLSPLLAAAAAAGLKAHFEHARNSFKIKISGFSDKARVFLKEVLKELTRIKPQSSDFELYCGSLSKCYENAQKELPMRQAMEKCFSILRKTKIASIEKLKELHALTYQDFLAFHSNLFAQTYIEAFFSGNLTIKEAKNCWFDLKQLLAHAPFPKNLHPKEEVFCLSDQGPYLVEAQTTAQGNGIILTIDQGAFSFEKRAAQAMLAIALKEAFYTTLRTKQKTGYIVWSCGQEIEKRLFQYFVVQSNSHECQDLLYRFELFLESFLQEIPYDIPMERFEKIRENYLLTLKNLCPNLQDKAATLDLFAFERDGDFKWLDKRIAAAKALRYEDFLKYAKAFFARENRKRLAVAVSGKLPATHNFSYKARSASALFKEGKYDAGSEK